MLSSLYILPFFKALLVSLVLSLVFVFLPWTKKYSWRKSSRHIHKKNISRLGGVAIILSFIFSILTDANLVITPSIWGVILASLVIMFYGLWDDFRKLDWRLQLFFQICATVIVFIAGVHIEYITNPLGGVLDFRLENFFVFSLFLGVGWILLLMNAMNWLDGIDGLSGGVTLIGSLTIFLLTFFAGSQSASDGHYGNSLVWFSTRVSDIKF